jgi:hypothetical protein
MGIKEHFDHPSGIPSLYLLGNKIGDNLAKYLSSALEVNKTLTELDLYSISSLFTFRQSNWS